MDIAHITLTLSLALIPLTFPKSSMAMAYVGKLSFVFCFRPEHVRYFLTEQQKTSRRRIAVEIT